MIVNLFSTIPAIGPGLVEWIRGDYGIADATLNRFFSLHVVALPLGLLLLVALHLVALRRTGSNNPDGIEIKEKLGRNGIPLDGIPFHPYYTVKDIVGSVVFLFVFSIIVFFLPEMGGYFLEANNFLPADPLKTPEHIAPVWYFTPFYSILRATTEDFMWYLRFGVVIYMILCIVSVKNDRFKFAFAFIGALAFLGMFVFEAKVWGVVLMGASVIVFALLPWLDLSPVKSIRYKGLYYKTALTLFVISFLVLGFLGTQPVSKLYTNMAQIGTLIYFAFFLLMPWYTTLDKTKPEPERVR